MLKSQQYRKKSVRQAERILGVVAFITIILAWIIGAIRSEKDIISELSRIMPNARQLEPLTNGLFVANTESAEQSRNFYLAVNEANGYGGPLKAAVAVDSSGTVFQIAIIDQKETPSYLERALEGKLLQSLLGKKVTAAFEIDKDVDAISGATHSSRGLTDAVRKASHTIGRDILGLEVPQTTPPELQFGTPETVLLLLFVMGFVGRLRNIKFTKQIQWASLVIGMVFLGFIYQQQLSLTKINSFMLGFIPNWKLDLFWILLIGGILFFITIEKKNPYCQWFCPFGAAQECLGVIGGAKVSKPNQYKNLLRWTQRSLAWLVILLALFFHNPGLTSYEIFGGLFSLTGSTIQHILVVIIVISSLFIKRPWCSYLCPIKPVIDYINLIRDWILELWLKTRQSPGA